MAQAEAEAKDAAGDAATPAGGKSKLVPLLLVVNTGLVAGVLIFTLTRKPPAPAAAAPVPAEHKEGEHGEAKADEHGAGAGKEAAPAAIGPTVRLENFVVQLRAVDAERYAHITLELELASDPDKDRVAAMLPRIRDTVIAYLADRTADELRGSEGLAKLKDAVLERLQGIVPGRKITNVYITDFIVQ